VKGLTEDQMALMERESANLERELKMAEQSYGADHLDLVLAKGYLGKLLGNARVVRYLAQHHHEFLAEFQRIAELETTLTWGREAALGCLAEDWGPGPGKRGDRGRRRTVGRIERGGGMAANPFGAHQAGHHTAGRMAAGRRRS
jgi:hypothetical protein